MFIIGSTNASYNWIKSLNDTRLCTLHFAITKPNALEAAYETLLPFL